MLLTEKEFLAKIEIVLEQYQKGEYKTLANQEEIYAFFDELEKYNKVQK